jgi:integrase
MSRRGNREGTFWKDDRGRWVGQVVAGHNPATGKRKRYKVTGAVGETKAEVAARLKARIDERDTSVSTVGELLSDWLTKAAPKRKGPSWLATCRGLVDSHIMPTFRYRDLNELTVEEIERWMADMSSSLSKATVVAVRSQLAQALDYGVRRRLLDWNPAKIAELPQSGSPSREGRSLTQAEARSLLNVASDHRLGAWVVTAMTLGLRPGEVSGLTWESINLEAGIVVVHQALAWDRNEPYLKSTKTKGTRTLDMPARTVGALKDHRKRSIEERLLMGDRWPVEWSDLVFVSQAGTPLIASNLRRLMSALAAAAGIEGAVTPYSLRHTATSLLSASGVAPELLADMLGHRDTRMVHRHYRHRVTPTISVARDHIEDAL